MSAILDDVIINTYDFLQLRPNLSNWRDKDELFDLGIIDK